MKEMIDVTGDGALTEQARADERMFVRPVNEVLKLLAIRGHGSDSMAGGDQVSDVVIDERLEG